MQKIIILILVLFSVSCSSKLSEKVIGEWKIDEAFLQEKLSFEEKNEEEKKAIFEAMKKFKVVFFDKSISVDFSSKKREYDYTIKEENEDKLVLNTVEKNVIHVCGGNCKENHNKQNTLTIVLLDDGNINIIPNSEDALRFSKVK